MSLLSFMSPSKSTVPPPGTSAHKAYLHATGSTPEQGASAYAAQQAVPPRGTSAYKAYEYFMENGRPAPSASEILGLDPPKKSNPAPVGEGDDVAYFPVDDPDYINAELASYYGMSKETAYQEALSNTAYQRSVKDMQAAGLNPAVLYGAGKGSPSDGVYSVRSASSGGGGSGGSSRRSSGSSKNNDKLFTPGEYYGISAAAGLVAAVVSGNPSNYWFGQTVSQNIMNTANNLFRK